jgi:hypothetical protein
MPIRHRTISCRDLAYERGMMDLVDIIDISSSEVTSNIKRYLQRRLHKRLDEIHKSYLVRMKEHDSRSMHSKGYKSISTTNENINKDVPSMSILSEDIASLPIQQSESVSPHQSHSRPYQSSIDTTLRQMASPNENSIDATGEKLFRYSGYKIRFRLNETNDTSRILAEQTSMKRQATYTPRISLISARNGEIKTPSVIVTRPKTTTTTNIQKGDYIKRDNFVALLPVRETRTSIRRSTRFAPTARIMPEVKVEKTSAGKLNLTEYFRQRSLSKRMHPMTSTAEYMARSQSSSFLPLPIRSTNMILRLDQRMTRH